MKQKLPILFVGSSSESLHYLSIVKEILGETVYVKPWNEKVFDPALGNYLSDIIEGTECVNRFETTRYRIY